MQGRYTLFILIACLLFLSCEKAPKEDGSSSDGKINYSYLAEKFCACAASSINLNVELEELKQNNQIDKLIERLPEAEKTFKEVVACCENILLNHSKEKLLPKKLDNSLMQKCEDLAPRLRKDLIAKMPK